MTGSGTTRTRSRRFCRLQLRNRCPRVEAVAERAWASRGMAEPILQDRQNRRVLPPVLLSRKCHAKHGGSCQNASEKRKREEKSACYISSQLADYLGQPIFRQDLIKLLRWLLTEGLLARI